MIAPGAPVAGVVLAGGRASRMGGRDKAFAGVEGEPIAVRAVRIFRSLFAQGLVSTKRPGRFAGLGVQTVADPVPGCGPLAGRRPEPHQREHAGGARRGRRTLRRRAVTESDAELVDVVNDAGETVAVVTRREMRLRRLPHRTCYVLVFNGRDELFTHLRTPTK